MKKTVLESGTQVIELSQKEGAIAFDEAGDFRFVLPAEKIHSNRLAALVAAALKIADEPAFEKEMLVDYFNRCKANGVKCEVKDNG